MAPQVPVNSILATFVFLAESPFLGVLLLVAIVAIGLAAYHFITG